MQLEFKEFIPLCAEGWFVRRFQCHATFPNWWYLRWESFSTFFTSPWPYVQTENKNIRTLDLNCLCECIQHFFAQYFIQIGWSAVYYVLLLSRRLPTTIYALFFEKKTVSSVSSVGIQGDCSCCCNALTRVILRRRPGRTLADIITWHLHQSQHSKVLVTFFIHKSHRLFSNFSAKVFLSTK